MIASGLTRKMPVALDTTGTAVYRFPYDGVDESVNGLIGRDLTITFSGEMRCVRCGKRVNKLFGEGFCYPCFADAPEASECIVRPELCRAHLGEGRDPEWEEEHHNKPHIVYLAVTNAVKVGVTREVQIPVRWIDQGAAMAVPIAHVPYRQLAGRIEVALKELYTDKTNWRRMLKNETLENVDFGAELKRIHGVVDAELEQYLVPEAALQPLTITYPVRTWPEKVVSRNLGKEGSIRGTLEGIRGQYLLFDDNRVMNVRRHSGMVLVFE